MLPFTSAAVAYTMGSSTAHACSGCDDVSAYKAVLQCPTSLFHKETEMVGFLVS